MITEAGPFKIHSDDEPFQPFGQTLRSANNIERGQAELNVAIKLKGEGKTAPDHTFRPPSGQFASAPDRWWRKVIRFVPNVGPGETDASYRNRNNLDRTPSIRLERPGCSFFLRLVARGQQLVGR